VSHFLFRRHSRARTRRAHANQAARRPTTGLAGGAMRERAEALAQYERARAYRGSRYAFAPRSPSRMTTARARPRRTAKALSPIRPAKRVVRDPATTGRDSGSDRRTRTIPISARRPRRHDLPDARGSQTICVASRGRRATQTSACDTRQTLPRRRDLDRRRRDQIVRAERLDRQDRRPFSSASYASPERASTARGPRRPRTRRGGGTALPPARG